MGHRLCLGLLVFVISACAETPRAIDPSVPTLKVSVSAYCLRGKTASGLPVRTGIAAADTDVLPLGSIIRLRSTDDATDWEGVYTILDTGPSIRGRRIDIHIPSCADARRFGRRSMVADILRHGWAPGGR